MASRAETCRGAALVLAAWASPGAGEPVVLAERGPTRPIGDYLPALQPPTGPPLGGVGPAPGPAYPFRSAGLEPGPVAARAGRFPALAGRPLFLVGSDPRSRAWLARHGVRLQGLGAAGLLVQADTPEDLAAVAALAPGVPLAPVDAGDLARRLSIGHYPVLISAGGIEQ
jgi:integrating conjugative element protein (TIGR03765 family)